MSEECGNKEPVLLLSDYTLKTKVKDGWCEVVLSFRLYEKTGKYTRSEILRAIKAVAKLGKGGLNNV